MALFNSPNDLRDEKTLYDLGYMIFSRYTWAGGPTSTVGRLLADGAINGAEAIKYLVSALVQSAGSTGAPSRELAELVAGRIVTAAGEYAQTLADATAARAAALAEANRLAAEKEAARVAASRALYPIIEASAAMVASGPSAAALAAFPASVPTTLPSVAPTPAPEVKKMSMVQQALEVVKGVGGAVGSVIKAGAEVLPVAAQILAKSTPQQYSMTQPSMGAGYEAIWRALAPSTEIIPSGEQFPQQMGPQTARGWRITQPGVRADRFIVQPHPITGMPYYWEAVGRPVLFSRDIAAARRVAKIAARAARGRGRRPFTIRRRRK